MAKVPRCGGSLERSRAPKFLELPIPARPRALRTTATAATTQPPPSFARPFSEIYETTQYPTDKMSKARSAVGGMDQVVKIIVGAGKASPSPPVGPALGSKGIKSMDFCKVGNTPERFLRETRC